MPLSPVKIMSQPGVKRDGTRLEGGNYIDGQWCRWYRGLPRKMGGYRMVSQSLTEKAYGMSSFVSAGQEYVHTGSKTKLYQQTLDYNSLLLTSSDRTPVTLTIDANNNWQFDILYDAVSASNRIIAHAAASLADIGSTANSHVFYGDVTGTGVLTNTAVTDVSGGICVAAPYLFKFGNDGQVDWSVANKPADFTNAGSGTARITGSKIVRALPLRGGGAGPSALFWSLDSLCRATFTGGTAIWVFDTISADVSILSSNGVVEYDGIYYWAGVDRFMMFNGVVREIPNAMSLDWFFDDSMGGLNYAQRQKVFAVKMPRWGEIWWCYPRGVATECTHAVIYNVREGIWYDTQLPDSGRSSGTFANVYEHPLMTGVDATSTATYKLWKHEEGHDSVDGTSINAIRSYFETNEISVLSQDKADAEQGLRCVRIEPDFTQIGPMSVTVNGRSNARAPVLSSTPATFVDSAVTTQQQTVPVKEARRLMSFKFESNSVGGHYQMGDCYAHIDSGDGRVVT